MPRKQEPGRILNCLPSPRTGLDWTYGHALESGIAETGAALPAAVDLRARWWTIQDQGATGACVGWATADSVLRWHFVTKHRLERRQLLSPRFLWMAAKELDDDQSTPSTFIETDGTSLKAALDVARKYGVVPDDFLPFASGRLFTGSGQAFFAAAARWKVAGYFNLKLDPEVWREWLATQGPVLVRLDVDDTWRQATRTRGRLDAYQVPAGPAGHAAALVGYGPDRWIIRNSWGAAWGDRGFAYASPGYVRDAITEAYGVVV